MSLAFPTGNKRTVTCECGVEVEETEHVITGVAVHGIHHWSKRHHDAPCGLPCFCAGVQPKVYRLGMFHRDSESCPNCNPGSSARRKGEHP